MKKSQILGFFIIYVSLSILKISSKSETWSPEPVRFGMEHTIYKSQSSIVHLNYFYGMEYFVKICQMASGRTLLESFACVVNFVGKISW